MSEETRSQSSLDQVEGLWKQWYETSSKMWTDVLESAKENYVDPYGLYGTWLKTLEENQESAGTMPDPREVWKKWFEVTGEIWRKAQEIGTNPPGMTGQWFELMEETRQKLLNGATLPADPFTFFKQWYDSSNEAWSKTIGELIGTEKFVEATSRYVESYTSFYKTFRRLNEEYFSKLQLTTRADLARVAEIIIALENKVDWIQDAFEDFQGQFPQFATLEAVSLVDTHLASLENKWQKLPAALEKIDTLEDLKQHLDSIEGKLNEITPALQKFDAIEGVQQRLSAVEWRLGEIPPRLDAIQGVEQRLSAVENKLNEIPPALQKIDAIQGVEQRLGDVEDRLGKLPGTLEKINAVEGLEKRLDGVENKLDKLLALLEQMGRQESTTATSARSTQRRTSRTKTAPQTPTLESEDTPS